MLAVTSYGFDTFKHTTALVTMTTGSLKKKGDTTEEQYIFRIRESLCRQHTSYLFVFYFWAECDWVADIYDMINTSV